MRLFVAAEIGHRPGTVEPEAKPEPGQRRGVRRDGQPLLVVRDGRSRLSLQRLRLPEEVAGVADRTRVEGCGGHGQAVGGRLHGGVIVTFAVVTVPDEQLQTGAVHRAERDRGQRRLEFAQRLVAPARRPENLAEDPAQVADQIRVVGASERGARHLLGRPQLPRAVESQREFQRQGVLPRILRGRGVHGRAQQLRCDAAGTVGQYPGRAHQPIQHPGLDRPGPELPGLQQLHRHPVHRGIGVAQHVGRLAVQRRAYGFRQIAVDDLPDQPVPEHQERTGLHQNLRHHRLRQRRNQLRHLPSCHRRQLGDREAGTQQRRQPQHLQSRR